ncbi:glycosyltransferase, partial [Rhodopirellula bahusiensis]
MKMKIACVIHSLDGGGAERVMAGLASRLANRAHSVTLITLDDGSHDRHEVDSSVSRQPIDVLSTPHRTVSLWTRIRHLRSA